MFGSNNVGSPQVLVVILSIPPAVFCRKVVNILEGLPLKNPFELSELSGIDLYVLRIFALQDIARPDFVPP
jgi:hypothetical protein